MKTLRLFASVARHRSFSRAAGEMGVTQSAASQRIRQLEDRLGTRLIDRSVRPLALTPAGERFFEGTEDVLRRYDLLERQVAEMSPELDGQVHVESIYSAGIGLLNRIKSLFEREQPRVSVGVEYKGPDEVYEAVRQQRCDLGIVSYPQSSSRVGVIRLREEPMALVCRPTDPLAERVSIHANELAERELLMFERSLPVGRRIRRYLRENGARARGSQAFDNIDTLKTAATVTGTPAILPKRTVLREVAAGSLAVVELDPPITRPLGIIYPRWGEPADGDSGPGPLSPCAQAFADCLLAHAGPNVDLIDEQEARGRELVGGDV